MIELIIKGKLKMYKRLISILMIITALILVAGCGRIEPEETGAVLKDYAISHDTEFGGIYINITIDDFNKLGFKFGDSINVKFSNGYSLEDIPYYNGYYTHNGETLLVGYPGYPYIRLGINNGDDLWKIAGVGEDDKADIEVNKAGAYIAIQEARNIQYEDERDKYSSDEVFANFRAVSVTGMKKDILYRAASPCDNQHNRAPYVDKLIQGAGVKTIIDLADNDEKIQKYIKADDFNSPYFLSLYEGGTVYPIALNMNYDSDEFREKLSTGMRAIIENDGPYLVHCTEGKDRTGFVCILLEAFCGASYDEILADYMTTYDNYYKISLTNEKDKYDTIIGDVLNPMVYHVAGDENADLKTADLAASAEQYMKNIGLSDDEIAKLRDRLAE